MRLRLSAVGMATAIFLSLFGIQAHAAGTLTYKYINGDPITATDSTAAAEFTNANAEITGAGYMVIAYVYDTCRLAEEPGDFTSNKELTAVTTKDVANYGTIGDAIWFIYDKTLYVTGNNTISDTSSTYSNTSRTDSHTGDRLDIYQPSLTYGDIEGEGYGIRLPYVKDEKDLKDTFYEYTAPAEDYLSMSLSDRAPTVIASGQLRFNKPATGKCRPTGVGWYPHAGEIETVYFSEDLSLVGNFGYMFNANSSYSIPGDVGKSKYTALKNVYLYSDVSGITSTAGMFARCPLLEHVYVKHGQVADLEKNTSTAFMFYGDENLVNGADSFIDAMDLSSGALINTTYMFGDCIGISQPNVKDYNMSNVTLTDGMFYGAKRAGLISSRTSSAQYNIYNWDLGNVISANFMFSGLMPLTDTDEPDLDNPQGNVAPGLGVIDGSQPIVDAIDISEWGLDKCVTTNYMFAKTSGITSLIMENGYDALLDASGMFMRCDNLKVVSAPDCRMPNLLYTTAMFRGAGMGNTGGKADFSGFTAPKLEVTDLMFEAAGFSIIDFNDSSDFSKVTSAKAMFADNNHLSSLGDGNADHFRFTALKDASYMFNGDSALPALNTSGWKMSSAETVSHMFSDCEALKGYVDFSGWTMPNSLTDMECFIYNTSIGAADLSRCDTGNVTNMSFAFAECPYLTKVALPANNNMSSVIVAPGMCYNDPLLSSVSTLKAAPALLDARGMFMGDKSLAALSVSELIDTAETKYLSFIFRDCSGLVSIDLSGWDTTGAKFMEGMFDGCTSLKTITAGSDFRGKNVLDLGTAFRNCYELSGDSLNEVLSHFSDSAFLEDAFEMCKNCYAVTSLDLSNVDFSGTTDLIRIAAMEENGAYATNRLTEIMVPSTILTAVGVELADPDDGGSINMFWVDGDGAADGGKEEDVSDDDLSTAFFVTGNTVPANLLSYNFGGDNGDNDNRSFIKFNGRTINGMDRSTYALANDKDKATMKVDAHSTFYTGGKNSTSATPLPSAYSWAYEGAPIAGAESNAHTVEGTKAGGTYVATSGIGTLTGSNDTFKTTFYIGTPIISITARYMGKPIGIGGAYSKDDVIVTAQDSNGNVFQLTSDDWTVDSVKVTKKGNNTYTVSYDTGGAILTTPLTVPGERRIGLIEAEYVGPSVLVGDEFDTSYVTVTAYYADDIHKTEGFEVIPSYYSTRKVKQLGDNKISVTYVDPDQDDKTFSDYIVVNGYKAISEITAVYTGPDIIVGEDYDKKDVVVTLYYEDGTMGNPKSKNTAVTENFTVDSTLVTKKGENPYTATYKDPFGNSYTATFKVNGIKKKKSKKKHGGDDSNDSSSGGGSGGGGGGAPSGTSTVAGPSGSYGYALGAPAYTGTATSTGIVRTGTTLKTFLYIISALSLIGVIALALYYKRKIEMEEKGKH